MLYTYVRNVRTCTLYTSTLASTLAHKQLYGSGSKPKACNKAGAHTRDIPRYKGYVTGARLAREALQF